MTAFRETGRDLLHDDIRLFFVRLEICENGDIHTDSVHDRRDHRLTTVATLIDLGR